jgi:hypothetical protein
LNLSRRTNEPSSNPQPSDYKVPLAGILRGYHGIQKVSSLGQPPVAALRIRPDLVNAAGGSATKTATAPEQISFILVDVKLPTPLAVIMADELPDHPAARGGT